MKINSFYYVSFIITNIVILNYTYAWINPPICPLECSCEETVCPEDWSSPCDDSTNKWNIAFCKNFSEEIASNLPQNLNSLTIATPLNETEFQFLLTQGFSSMSVLSVMFVEDVELNASVLPTNYNILHLNLSNGVLRMFPPFMESFPNLKILNISNNAISSDLDLTLLLEKLEVFDLSQNGFHKLSLQGKLGNLRELMLQNNQLELLPNLIGLPQLEILDISNNGLIFEMETNQRNCAIHLPSRIETLNVRGNSMWKIPENSCGLLAGLTALKHLDLGNNLLLSVSSADFPPIVQRTLLSLVLDKNQINHLNPDAFDGFISLKFLSLSSNYLRSIPLEIFRHLGKQLDSNFESRAKNNTQVLIVAKKNPVSCDCTQQEMLELLQMQNSSAAIISPDDMVCSYPYWLFGSRLADLESEDLTCYNTTMRKPENTSCHEYNTCKLSCIFDGLPHPQTHWISPIGEKISTDALSNDASLRDSYSLSGDGHILTIAEMQMSKTGIYKCVANNSMSSLTGIVQVGVILAPVGSIVAIIVSVVSFLVAILLNSVNLCHYYCQHLRDKRAMREAEAMSFKMESPIKSKRKGLHESEASLNANKYYRKYDFTCQQVFLDTVIKGAHTVKRTLYDARNSEFSTNVWEYASHLRDRLHIELPSSVQFPRVSMPSISMPTISMPNITMPSMPNLQSINTNIERIGTSVMNRSHTLATSVGSVFTMRWLRPGNSDNESDSDLESAGVSQVQVLVHKSLDEVSTPGLQSSVENSPITQPKLPKLDGPSWLKRKMMRQPSTSRDDTAVPRRAKSVRFTENDRPVPSASHIRRSASYSNITSISITDLPFSLEHEHAAGSVKVVCNNVPESYQFETTV